MKTLLTALILTASTAAVAIENTLFWDIPTERVDGTELPQSEIMGYRLYQNGSPIQFIEDATQISIKVLSEKRGNYCFTISTVDTDEVEGPHSPELCLDFFPAPPAAPALRSSF